MKKGLQLPLLAAVPAAFLLASCGYETDGEELQQKTAEEPRVTGDQDAGDGAERKDMAVGRTPSRAATWEMISSGEGDALVLAAGSGRVHLSCPSSGGFLVNIGSFRPIGSEERMSVGSGTTVVTLVADPSGDELRGGVTGEGPVPAALRSILSGPDGLAVNYGAQDIGPLPPVPQSLARNFGTGCTD